MSTQIAIRLPDELVEHLDNAVRNGIAATRSGLIRILLSRELRRSEVAAELAVLSQPWNDPDDLDGLAEWTGRQSLTIED